MNSKDALTNAIRECRRNLNRTSGKNLEILVETIQTLIDLRQALEEAA